MRRNLFMGLVSLLLLSACATVDPSWSRVDVTALRSDAEAGDLKATRTLAELIARGVAQDGDIKEAIERLEALGPASRPVDRALLALTRSAHGNHQDAFADWLGLITDESVSSWLRQYAALRARATLDHVSLAGVDQVFSAPVDFGGAAVQVSDLLAAIAVRLNAGPLMTLAERLAVGPVSVKRSGRLRSWSGLKDVETHWDVVPTRRGSFVMPDEGPGVYEVRFQLPASPHPRVFEVRAGASVAVWWGEQGLGRQDRWRGLAPAHSRWTAPAGQPGEVRLRFLSTRGGFSPRVILLPPERSADPATSLEVSSGHLVERMAELERALHERDAERAERAADRLERDRLGLAVDPLVRRLGWDPTLAPERTGPSRTRLLVEAIKATQGLALAEATLIRQLLDDGDVEKARALRDSATLGDEGDRVDLRIAVEVDRQADARRVASKVLDGRPHSCEAATDWLELHWESLAARQKVERPTWPGCVEVFLMRARLALDSARPEDAIPLATEAARNAQMGEQQTEATLLLAEALWRSDRAAEAMEVASRFVITRQPGVDQVLDWIVRHGAPESVQQFEDRLRAHQGLSQEVRASALRPDDIGLPLTELEGHVRAALDEAEGAVEADYPVDVVFQERFIRPLADGTLLHRHHQLFLMRSEDAVESWGEIPLPEGSEVLVARTWRRGGDGRLLAAESEDWASTGAISLVGLGEGTVAEVSVVWMEDPDEAHSPTWSTARLPMGFEDARVRDARVVLAHDANMAIQVESGGPVHISRSSGRIEAKVKGVAPRPVEPLDPRPELRQPWVRFSGGEEGGLSIERWHAAETLRAARALRVTPTVQARAQELTRDLTDDRARLRALHSAVLSEIQDEAGTLGAFEASVILGRGAGERTIALVALCRAAGLRCDLVAARPVARGFERPLETLVDDDDWAYPIVRAVVGEETLWMDTASAHAPFDFVPPMLAGVEGLVLDERLSRIRLPEADELERGHRKLAITVRLAPDGTYVAEGHETLTGLYAMSWRHVLVELTPDQRKNALDRLVQASLPGSGLEEVSFQNLESRRAPLMVRWRARGSGLIGEEEARLSVALSPENLSRATVHLATRTAPLLVSRSTDLEVEFTLILPSVWRMETAPSSIQVDKSLVRYAREASLEGSTLRIQKSCALSVGLIAPEGYADWVEAARNVDRADRIELVLTRPPQ